MSENNEGALTPAPEGSRPAPSVLRQVQGMWGVKGSGDTSGFSGLTKTELMAQPASRPYGGWFDEVVDILIELFEADGIDRDEAIEKVVVENGQLVIFIAREHIVRAARYLRDDQDLERHGQEQDPRQGDADIKLHRMLHLGSVIRPCQRHAGRALDCDAAACPRSHLRPEG